MNGLETCHRNPVGSQSHPAKVCRRPEPSVARVLGQPGPRSVHREHAGRVMEPRNRICCGSRRLRHGGRQQPGAVMASRTGPPGSESGACVRGFPRNLGGPADLRHTPTGRAPGEESPGTKGRYRQAKATKRGGMDGRKSEQPIVPRESGNPPQGTRRGKGLPGSRNRWRDR
jgi:hypothetical protein